MSSFALTESERNELMEQVYGGYTRSPLMTRGNKATGGADRRHKNAGKIDYFAYGGKVASDFNDGIAKRLWDKSGGSMPNMYRAQGENWRNRDTWKKVAKHLGIKKVDSETDLRQMYDFVAGYKYQKEDDSGSDSDNNQTAVDPNPSNTDRPDSVKQDQQKYLDTKLDRPENQMPRLEDAFRGTTDATMGAIRGGDDLNEHYQKKFVPHLEADARATSSEIGDDSRFFLSKFTFEPPKLGSIKDIFDKYKGEIEDLD